MTYTQVVEVRSRENRPINVIIVLDNYPFQIRSLGCGFLEGS